MMKHIRFMLVALGLALMSSRAHSQMFLAYDLGTSTAGFSYTGNQTFDGTVGMQFTVNSRAIVITSLGVFDGSGDGFHNVLTTYLFDGDTHALLASQTFNGSTNDSAGYLVGYNRFKDLSTGLILNPGHYVIASSGFIADSTGSDPFGQENMPGFVADTFDGGSGLISSVGPSLMTGSGGIAGDYPTVSFGSALAFNAGTFQYTPYVPEPGSVALMGSMTGLGGMLALRRARKRSRKR